MLYKAYLEQHTDCDNSIACGKICLDIIADSLEEAAIKLKELIKKRYSFYPYKVDACQLFEVNNVIEMDLSTIFSELVQEQVQYEYNRKNSKQHSYNHQHPHSHLMY